MTDLCPICDESPINCFCEEETQGKWRLWRYLSYEGWHFTEFDTQEEAEAEARKTHDCCVTPPPTMEHGAAPEPPPPPPRHNCTDECGDLCRINNALVNLYRDKLDEGPFALSSVLLDRPIEIRRWPFDTWKINLPRNEKSPDAEASGPP